MRIQSICKNNHSTMAAVLRDLIQLNPSPNEISSKLNDDTFDIDLDKVTADHENIDQILVYIEEEEQSLGDWFMLEHESGMVQLDAPSNGIDENPSLKENVGGSPLSPQQSVVLQTTKHQLIDVDNFTSLNVDTHTNAEDKNLTNLPSPSLGRTRQFTKGNVRHNNSFSKAVGSSVDKSLVCKEEGCSYSGKTKKHLLIHTKTQHGDGKRFMCSECGYKCERPALLQLHVQVKHEGHRFACELCDYKATIPIHLKRHMDSKHNGKQWSCDECNFVGKWAAALRTHKKAKHSGKVLSCKVCEKQFVWPSELRKHNLKEHTSTRLLCNQCDYVALDVAALNRHAKYKHGQHERKPCTLCNKSLRNVPSLQTHYRNVHGTTMPKN